MQQRVSMEDANAGKPEEGPPNTMISAYGGSVELLNADNSTGGEKEGLLSSSKGAGRC